MSSVEATVTLPQRDSTFRTLLTAFGISSLGDGIRTAALPLLAVFITHNPIAIAGLAIAGRLPWLLVSLFSGAVADRYDRRKLMIGVDATRGIVLLALVALMVGGVDGMPVLYVVALALGVGETLFDTATSGFLPEVVRGQELAKANGQIFSTKLVGSDFVGPAAGSWLFAIARSVPFLADAISFLLSAVLVGFVRRRTDHPAADSASRPAPARRSMLHEVKEGLLWTRNNDVIRSFLIMATGVNFVQSAVQSLLVLLAVNDFGIPAGAYGLLLTGTGVGAFLGGLLSARVGDRIGIHRVLLPAVASGVPLLLLIAWTHQPVVLGASLAVNAFMGVLAGVQTASLRQRIVPNELMGRVSSVGQFFCYGLAIPLGSLLAGVLARLVGVRMVYMWGAVVTFIVVLLIFRDLNPRKLRETVDLIEKESPA